MALDALTDTAPALKQRKKHADAHAKIVNIEVDWLREKVLDVLKHRNIAINNSRREQSKVVIHKSQDSVLVTNSYYGLHGLDKKLETYLDYDEGFFVELGANDGVTQSNTLYFEKTRKWRGILVEPILHNFLKCKSNRSPDNSIVCAACVSFGYEEQYVELNYSNLMTTSIVLESDVGDPVAHAESGKVFLESDEDVVEIMAVAKTLNSILDNEHAPTVIDLLSLDVEGAEIEVLKGVDHNKYRFKYLLIESRNLKKIDRYLGSQGYEIVKKLSQHDYLFSDIAS
ncbi:MAG: FkbM family methyltransferase [endosymbiont of Seepiophila jonesi]|uniref:FkbM family methyltransferase n=1 Tax=endosymbiont of Lamellibrachia luymesi TaxID=2200907 RepID=A0A370E036_9GAMM|nr:MAG: FkbM family methyltransferase [endosymbiont of Seepiophila jonesi]RDH92488.1 MAG: FkbM family methyltransferase [endosymbiont of Lamellibrachia luymesi]